MGLIHSAAPQPGWKFETSLVKYTEQEEKKKKKRRKWSQMVQEFISMNGMKRLVLNLPPLLPSVIQQQTGSVSVNTQNCQWKEAAPLLPRHSPGSAYLVLEEALQTEPFFGLNQTPGLFAHLNHAAVLLRGVLQTP